VLVKHFFGYPKEDRYCPLFDDRAFHENNQLLMNLSGQKKGKDM